MCWSTLYYEAIWAMCRSTLYRFYFLSETWVLCLERKEFIKSSDACGGQPLPLRDNIASLNVCASSRLTNMLARTLLRTLCCAHLLLHLSRSLRGKSIYKFAGFASPCSAVQCSAVLHTTLETCADFKLFHYTAELQCLSFPPS